MNRQLNKTQSDLIFDILRRYFNDHTIGGKVYNKFNREWTDTTCIAGGKAREVKEKYLDTKLKKWLYERGWLKFPEMEEEVKQIMIARDNDLTELRRKYSCTPHYGGYFGKRYRLLANS